MRSNTDAIKIIYLKCTSQWFSVSFQSCSGHHHEFQNIFPQRNPNLLVCCVLSHVLLFMTPWTVDCRRPPLSMGFSRQEYWSGLSLPSPGDLHHPGIEPESPVPPALADGFFTTEPFGKPYPLAVTPCFSFPSSWQLLIHLLSL